MIRSNRGFTLVELLVAMVLFAMVGLSLVQTMVVVQRTTRTQSEQTAMQGSLRAGLQLAITELEELTPNPDPNAGGADFSAGNMGATSFRYRAMRILSQMCDAVTANSVTIRATGSPLYSGFRAPVNARDSMLIFEDRDTDESTDDHWIRADITGVASGTCADGATAYVLTTATALTPANFTVPAPVRIFETMRLGVVAQNGRNWLGLQSETGGDASLTPLAGPLASSGQPVSLFYRNATNTTAASPAEVRSIIIRLAGESDRSANAGGNSTPGLLADTVTVRVQLRNTH
jgi:prepilin-type N-terminal cleavage/methylation domain-containing protein